MPSTKVGLMRGGWIAAIAFAALAPLCAQGAEPHWAYVKPARPALPEVRSPQWPRDPIDAFVLARLERDALVPSPEADPQALLRRATLVLTGLPPTLDEIEAFRADPSPDAYARAIDRLLASPRYGERMAVPWLDLARYADTHGYHSDSERVMWPWRDWVIDALNGGLPFDRFTIEQLAGDLLPNATLDQRLATGLHRNHMLNDENGAIPAEYHAEYVADRVATTGTIWLGQALSCARCHDHKYDPLSQREYYQLFAFFNNVPENGLGGKTGNAPPTLSVPTKFQRAELNELDARMDALQRQMQKRAASAAGDFARWAATAGQEAGKSQPPTDAVLKLPLNGDGDAASSLRVKGEAIWVPGKFDKALLFNGQTHVEVPAAPKWDRNDAFSVSAWVFPTTADTMTVVGRVDEAQSRRGFEWTLGKGRPVARLTHTAGEDEIEVRAAEPLKQHVWQHLAFVYDASAQAAGIAIYVNGALQSVEVQRDALRGHILGDQPLTIGRGDAQSLFRGMLDEVQFFSRALRGDEVRALAGGNPIQEVLALAPRKRTAEQRAALARHYLEHHDAEYRAAFESLATFKSARDAILRDAPEVMVMQELAEPRTTFVLDRGLYDEPGERVTAGTPAILPPLDADGPPNRLDLAMWLVDPNHPLTGRVAVNREWQTVFGAGLVRTPDDFGVRGEKPTHPELLDYLAREYVDRGWNTKRLHRRLVSSATFRQQSRITPELAARDPENRLWARGPRHRLTAEAIRDQALAAAGLLDLRIGGPSVKPYQPAELWRELAYDPNDYSAQVFVPSSGADLYRRSLYTFWKRSVPPPNLALFDAPDRETCVAQRDRSNTPQAALVLMNDTTFVEAARKLAERVLHGPGSSDAERIDRLMLCVISRLASRQERALLLDQLDAERRAFQSEPAQAKELLAVGESTFDASLDAAELAAWTLVASTILNTDEAINVR